MSINNSFQELEVSARTSTDLLTKFLPQDFFSRIKHKLENGAPTNSDKLVHHRKLASLQKEHNNAQGVDLGNHLFNYS